MARPSQREIPLPTRIIPDSQRLVSKSFRYGRREMEADVVKGVDWTDERGRRFDGYPQRGLHLSEEEFGKGKRDHTLLRRLVGDPGNRKGIPYFVDHYGRYDRNGILDPRADDIQNLPTDTFPLHPFARAMLTKSRLGAFTGLGYYWRRGEQITGDAFIVRLYKEKDIEKAAFAAIRGGDRRGWALLGGDNDTGESTFETAVREAWEEGKIDLRNRPHALIRRRTIVGDWRATISAWPVTAAYVFVLDERNKTKQTKLVAEEGEVVNADWLPLTAENIANLSFHGNIARLGVRRLEKKWGIVVAEDGNIGKAA